MKKYKGILIIIVLIIMWGFLLFIFSEEKVKTEKELEPQIVILNGNNHWLYKSGNWINILNQNDPNFDLINWKKFDVYIDNTYNDTYTYSFKDANSYFFDDNLKSYEISNDYILINEGSFISLLNYEQVQLNNDDYDVISDFLKKNNINANNYKIAIKYSLDNNDSVYVISNYDKLISKNDIFYLVFYRRNGRNYLIVNSDYSFNYNLHAILDVKDKFYSFVLRYGCYDGYCYDLFKYDGKKYVKVLGTETE